MIKLTWSHQAVQERSYIMKVKKKIVIYSLVFSVAHTYGIVCWIISQMISCFVSFQKMYSFLYLSQTIKVLYLFKRRSRTELKKNLKSSMDLQGLNCIKSVLLNKINTLAVVILWLLTFCSSKIVWPPIFLSNNLLPIIFGTPQSEENDIAAH